MLCEEGMTTTKARSALSVPRSNTRKIDKYCTNCGMNNHNVETSRKKKK
jgi:hypothetical protein